MYSVSSDTDEAEPTRQATNRLNGRPMLKHNSIAVLIQVEQIDILVITATQHSFGGVGQNLQTTHEVRVQVVVGSDCFLRCVVVHFYVLVIKLVPCRPSLLLFGFRGIKPHRLPCCGS